jgi:hypothetical protein
LQKVYRFGGQNWILGGIKEPWGVGRENILIYSFSVKPKPKPKVFFEKVHYTTTPTIKT